MEWNTDHGVAIKNIVYDVQLPFVSVIGCLSRPGETLQYKGNRKGKVVQFQNLRLDTDCKRYGAEQTSQEFNLEGIRGRGLKSKQFMEKKGFNILLSLCWFGLIEREARAPSCSDQFFLTGFFAHSTLCPFFVLCPCSLVHAIRITV